MVHPVVEKNFYISIVHRSSRRESVHDIKKYIHCTITILRQATLRFPHNYCPAMCHTWIGWNFLGFTGAARDSLTLSFRLPLPPSISSCTQRFASPSTKLLSLHHALPLIEVQHGASIPSKRIPIVYGAYSAPSVRYVLALSRYFFPTVPPPLPQSSFLSTAATKFCSPSFPCFPPTVLCA